MVHIYVFLFIIQSMVILILETKYIFGYEIKNEIIE